MWKYRKPKDYYKNETIGDQQRDSISSETIRELLERLCLAESWMLRYLLGEEYVVRAAAINVKIFARIDLRGPEKHYGDLYLVQNLKTELLSLKLFSPKSNNFIWCLDQIPNLEYYVMLKGNTHILHRENSMYLFKFPDKREATLFSDNLKKLEFLETSKETLDP